MSEGLDEIQDEVREHGKDSRLNGLIALFVAVVATGMALCNVKDGNVVQAMQQAQARAVDQWAYYPREGSKRHLAEFGSDVQGAGLACCFPLVRRLFGKEQDQGDDDGQQ